MKLFKKHTEDNWYCDHIREDGTIIRVGSLLEVEAIEFAAERKGLTECWWINNKGEKFDSFKYISQNNA